VRLKIRHLIIAMIVVFVLIPMLLTDWLLTRRAGDALMDNIKRDVADTAGEVADDVAEYLNRGELIVRFLARAPAFRLGTGEKIEQVLDSIIRPFPFAVHACYIRGNEAIMCRPAGILRLSGIDPQDTPWYTLAMEQGRFVWTGAYLASDSGRPIIAGTAPVVAGRAAGGVVALEFDLRAIWDLLRRYRLGKRGTIFIVDEADRLVSHRRPEWLLRPATDVMPILSREELQGRTAAIMPAPERAGASPRVQPRRSPLPPRGRRPAPGERVIAWAPIESPEWSVGVIVPLAEYRGVLRSLHILGLSVAGLAFACALAFGVILCRMIVCPIGELAEGTKRIAGGDYEHRVEVGRRNELGDLAESFNAMADQLEEHRKQERLAVIGRMASGVIHDLRTPMAVIRASLPVLLRQDVSDDEKKELAQVVDGAVERMAGMTQDVLEYARGESAGPKLETMDVREFVESLEKALRRDFELSGMKLAAEVRGTMRFRIDREKLARAFYNIAGNARDAMGETGTFSISAQSLDHRVRFVLSDTGPGIPEEIVDTVFEPFVTSGKQHGAGLGLAIAREIVRAHDGEIQVESRPGEGARFVIDLPAAAPES